MTGAAEAGREPYHRRTFDPVRRRSRPRGAEAGLWGPVDPAWKWRILRAAERFDLLGKAAGRRNGPLGYVGLKVLKGLIELVDHRTGRLDPALLTLAARLKLAKSAIVRALARLKAEGFLDWMRRFVATGERGVRGPQVAQATNAYRLALPAKAEALLRPAAPPPLDFAQARADRAAAIRAMAVEDFDAKVAARRALRRGPNASRPGVQNPEPT